MRSEQQIATPYSKPEYQVDEGPLLVTVIISARSAACKPIARWRKMTKADAADPAKLNAAKAELRVELAAALAEDGNELPEGDGPTFLTCGQVMPPEVLPLLFPPADA